MNRLSTHPVLSLLAAVAIISVSLTACEAEMDSPAYDEEPIEQTADSPVSESDTVISITMREFEFEPAEFTLPAGEQITLKFENAGSVTHEFMAGSEVVEEGEGFQTGLFSGVDVHFRKNGEQIKHDESANGMRADSADARHGEMAADTTGSDETTEQHEHHGKMLYLEPGDVGSMTFTLPESKTGEYTVGCFESSGDTMHMNRGMRGTITVEAAAQAG